MSDIHIRITGRAGRITLQRPQALNAMTYEMCLAIEAAIDDWRGNDAVALVVIDAEGDRAFCSGGDIADLYAQGRNGNFAYGAKFWADEYRLNHKIHSYPKPFVSFLQGFTMGGGVGIGCHGSHRIVGETSQIAMPECGIGLVPDVGGSLLLARAPGFSGTYLGTTTARMNAADAIYVGFADGFIPEVKWPDLLQHIEASGDVAIIQDHLEQPPSGRLCTLSSEIDAHFAVSNIHDIKASLTADPAPFATEALKKLSRVSPLSAAYTVEMLNRLRAPGVTMTDALELEYRFTSRASEHGDFLEGIRAAIIDKDRNPKWQHAQSDVPQSAIDAMFEPTTRLTL
ncbi:MAG: enoyl-CoA hydratase/isomerase family protein [Pseudomonadota bacterium]